MICQAHFDFDCYIFTFYDFKWYSWVKTFELCVFNRSNVPGKLLNIAVCLGMGCLCMPLNKGPGYIVCEKKQVTTAWFPNSFIYQFLALRPKHRLSIQMIFVWGGQWINDEWGDVHTFLEDLKIKLNSWLYQLSSLLY